MGDVTARRVAVRKTRVMIAGDIVTALSLPSWEAAAMRRLSRATLVVLARRVLPGYAETVVLVETTG